MPPRLPQITRRIRSRTAAQGAGLAAALTAFAWYFGADVWHAVLLGAVLATVVWIAAVLSVDSAGGETDWPESERPNRAGARNDISQLSISLRGRRGRVSDTAVWRVQRIAERRLAQLELELRNPADRPRIEQLIGRRSYRLLLRRRTGRQPSLPALLRCLDALDALDPSHRP